MNPSIALQLGPVSSAAPGPLYEQLMTNIKREILNERLVADAPLPSTRGLAADLRVSVITISRAYEELEKEGLVYSRQGQRTFVAADAMERLRLQQGAPWDAMVAAVEAGRRAKLGDEQIIRLMHLALRQRGRT